MAEPDGWVGIFRRQASLERYFAQLGSVKKATIMKVRRS